MKSRDMSKVTRINPKDTDFLEICMSPDGIPLALDDFGVWHEPQVESRGENGGWVYLWKGLRKPRWRPYDGGPKEAA